MLVEKLTRKYVTFTVIMRSLHKPHINFRRKKFSIEYICTFLESMFGRK